MASRVTQTVRAVVTDTGTPQGGGLARVTQTTRAIVTDTGTPQAGGLARVTQVARIIISTVYPVSSGFPILTGSGFTSILTGLGRRMATPVFPSSPAVTVAPAVTSLAPPALMPEQPSAPAPAPAPAPTPVPAPPAPEPTPAPPGGRPSTKPPKPPKPQKPPKEKHNR